jgi:hypothetical protein
MIAEVRLAFHYQRIFWEVVRAGAALGAEEVQDQRLAAAETPPEANPALDLFLFIVMWSVEGPVAASIIGAARAGVVAALERQMRIQATAYRRLIEAEVASATGALREARRIAAERAATAARASAIPKRFEDRRSASRLQRIEAAARTTEAAQEELRRALSSQQLPQVWSGAVASQRSGLRQTAQALQGIRRQDLPEYISAFFNIGLQQPIIRFPGPERAAGMSAGVTVHARIEKQALELIQESYLQQECYELGIVQDTALTAARAARVFDDIGVPTPVDVGGLIDGYQLLTAALIWGELFDVRGLRAHRAAEQDARSRTTQSFASDPLPPGSRASALAMTAPQPHQRYLRARFASVAEAWAREHPSDVLLPGVRFPGRATPQEVEQYIAAGTGAAPGLLQRLPTLLESLTGPSPRSLNDPDAWRLDLVVQWLSALAEQTTESLVHRT